MAFDLKKGTGPEPGPDDGPRPAQGTAHSPAIGDRPGGASTSRVLRLGGDTTREAKRPRAPLLNTLRPITGHARAVYTAPGRGSEGGSRAKLTQHPYGAWPRVVSHIPPRRGSAAGADRHRRR